MSVCFTYATYIVSHINEHVYSVQYFFCCKIYIFNKRAK